MTENMTIESFFLADYQRLKKENDELKATIQEHELEKIASTSDCGFTDLGKKVEAIRCEVAGSYCTFDDEATWGNLDTKKLTSLIEKEDDALLEEARRTKQRWGGFVYEEEKRIFPFTVEFASYKGRRRYAYDPDYGRTTLVEVDEKSGTGRWVNARLEENCRREAAEAIRDTLRGRIEELNKDAE